MNLISIHTKIFKIILKPFSGLGLGKKLPFLWNVYDFFFRIFAPKKPFPININDSLFWVNPKEKVKHVRKWMQNYILEGTYEEVTTSLIENEVKKGDVVIDIGASIGVFSMKLSKCVGEKGRVFSFEPTREGFSYLCENIKLNNAKNITPLNFAAWEKFEPVRMPKSSFATNAQWSNGVSISEYLKINFGIDKIDFIKMDIDGAEPWAVKGLIDIFEKNKDLKMVCEYYPKYIEASDGNPKDFHDILEKYFDLQIIEGDYGDGYWNYFCKRK
jgi:FkbM family methyltransferase|tara:strand:+ start:2323 stop:3138 length:816 start_codon:yes stop_codon:yes gene_type:complete